MAAGQPVSAGGAMPRAVCRRRPIPHGPQRPGRRSLVRRRTAAGAPDGSSLTLFCPAKINLFLRIMGKRPDGFHDLASLFQTLELGDTLTLTTVGGGEGEDSLRCDDADGNPIPGIPLDSSNLVIRALNLFRSKTGSTARFNAHLTKRVPAEAGMGGGSSDCAAALWGANALCGWPASEDDLREWSGDLGSDISFFFSSGTAYCTGRGEIVRDVEPLPASNLHVIKPPEGLSTPAVFKEMDLSSTSQLDPEVLLQGVQRRGVAVAPLVNDLEPPAFRCMPSLQRLRDDLLSHGFDRVIMSGSGTTLFALGDAKDRAAFDAFAQAQGLFVARTRFLSRTASDGWFEADQPDEP